MSSNHDWDMVEAFAGWYIFRCPNCRRHVQTPIEDNYDYWPNEQDLKNADIEQNCLVEQTRIVVEG